MAVSNSRGTDAARSNIAQKLLSWLRGRSRLLTKRVFFNLLLVLSLLPLVISISESTVCARPDSSASAATAGEEIEVEGSFVILHEDFKHSSRYLYFLDTRGGRIPLRFKSEPPINRLTGDQVRVRGRQSGGSLLLASGSTSITAAATPTSAAPLPNTLGAQSTLVILVNFQDAPANQPYTLATAQSVVFGTASNFILENSYQQTWLTGDVVGWYTIPLSSTTCPIWSIATYAQAAASAAGINLSSYTRYVYAFPQNSACGFAGASNVGGSPSQSWINGTDSYGDPDLHTVAHELGHAFGLWHSHGLDCGTGATIGSNCTIWEYGDILDVMGASQPASPHYGAVQKERLGWLNYGLSPAITTVNASGSYAITNYELGSGPNALKVFKSLDPATGNKTWYYLESRQAVGFDAFLTNGTCSSCYTQTETNGVLFHIGTDNNASSSDLLDMTPATPSYYFWFDPSLVVGQSFSDPAAGVTITTTSVTLNGAVVNVQFAPALAVAPNQQSYSLGQTVSITATAIYAGPVANNSVSFTVSKPNGTVVTGKATSGSVGTAVYNLKLKNTDPRGTYQVGATATINGTPVSAATSFTVQ
jgi:M6 family metalloprotease-like protein